jgi:hypothetical protein
VVNVLCISCNAILLNVDYLPVDEHDVNALEMAKGILSEFNRSLPKGELLLLSYYRHPLTTQ